jgi:undecaprenyl diphosphate synthase
MRPFTNIETVTPRVTVGAISARAGIHVAIIPGGNDRWSAARGLPTSAGHRAAVETARQVIAAAPEFGIHMLSLFVLSSEKAQRKASEAVTVLGLLQECMLAETSAWVDAGVRVSVIGRRERLPNTLRQIIQNTEAATANGSRLHLRLAVNYSARESLFLAACRFYKATELSVESFGKVLGEFDHGGSSAVDLIIRTGGEQRLGNFLLWECCHAEAIFLKKRWPDFTAEDLAAAVREYARRASARGTLLEAAAG